MRDISMSYVTPAFLARRKRVTRRQWKKKYAKSFKKGEKLKVMSKQRRFGGEEIGVLELNEAPYLENIDEWRGKEEQLYRDEGFAFMEDKNIVPEHAPLLKMTYAWVDSGEPLWVLPFDTIEVDSGAEEKYLTDVEMDKARSRLFKSITGHTIADITPKDAYIRRVA